MNYKVMEAREEPVSESRISSVVRFKKFTKRAMPFSPPFEFLLLK
jgi:hypothetical protein